MHYLSTLSIIAAAASMATAAKVTFNNHCNVPVQIVQSRGGYGDEGVNGVLTRLGGKPFVLNANGGTLDLTMVPNNNTSIKYGKKIGQGVSQFEYFLQPNNPASAGGPANWWDLSDLDGSVKGQGHSSGSPFFNDNVEIKPVTMAGKAAPGGNCVPLKCKAGEVCKDSYQKPDDKNTRFCPLSSVQDFTVDLCISQFTTRADSIIDIAEREVTKVAKKAIAFIA